MASHELLGIIMGCDIHAYVEKRVGDHWEALEFEIFEDGRSYSIFGFLAGVRNYSAVTPIAEPRGLPADVSDTVRASFEQWGGDGHTSSWLTLEELLAFDYDAMMEDRRCTREIAPNCFSGGETCAPGEGKIMSYREFLFPYFFANINGAKHAGAERIVFWFDN